MTYSICLEQDLTNLTYLGRRDGIVFMSFFTMVLFAKKHIFQCGPCKMQTLDCSPVVIMQTEGKMPTEVLLYVSSKQTEESAPWFSLNSSGVRLNITRISWVRSRGFGGFHLNSLN